MIGFERFGPAELAKGKSWPGEEEKGRGDYLGLGGLPAGKWAVGRGGVGERGGRREAGSWENGSCGGLIPGVWRSKG